jgi:hypothetical protein
VNCQSLDGLLLWDGTLLKAVLSMVAEENMIKKNFCSSKNNQGKKYKKI